MNTRKRVFKDARQKLNQRDARAKLNQISVQSKLVLSRHRKAFDARNKLNTLSKLKTKEKSFDARIKIQGNTAKPKPVLKEKKKVVTDKFPLIKTLVINNSKETGTSRTIRNPSAIALKRKEENIKDFRKYKPTGFISVTNGSRVLLNKVTVEPAGMKIMVRNDAALVAKAPAKNQNAPNAENPERKGLRITMTNPDAIKKQPKPNKQNLTQTGKPTRKRPIAQTRQPPPSPISVIRNQSVSVLKSKPVVKQAKRLRLAPANPRPMISTKNINATATQKPAPQVSVSEENRTSFGENEIPVDMSSPFEGTKIIVSNLHPVVVEEDILELFSVLGPVRRARLIGSGKAEIVFIRRDDAIRAYQKYNNRDLDGQPMRMKLLLQERAHQPAVKYSWQSEIKSNPKKGSEIIEIEANTLQRALFKGGSTGSSTRPVVFTVKI